MRIWTLHPRYLDAKGLVAAWREALLAQKVLRGGTAGYRHHPQLIRFRAQPDPGAAIAALLAGLAAEARHRGYHFDETKIARRGQRGRIPETRGQLQFEWSHLKRKLKVRAPAAYRECRKIAAPAPHPLFRIVAGRVRSWEKTREKLRGEVNLPKEPDGRQRFRRHVAVTPQRVGGRQRACPCTGPRRAIGVRAKAP